MKLTFVILLLWFASLGFGRTYFPKSHNFKHSYSLPEQKKSLKFKKARPSIGFEDKSALTMLPDNPYFKSRSPSITLNLGLRF